MGRHKLPRPYSQESVEAALELHVPGSWSRLAITNGGPAYAVTTSAIGEVRFLTLKEAFAFTVGCAEADRRRRIAS